MIKRGRVSAAEKNITVIAGAFGERPAPPADFNERQAEIWRQIVASEPGEFFNTATVRDMLANLCRHREAADRLAVVIDGFELEWLKSDEGSRRYALLLRMRVQETRAAASFATKLRLTNQSRYVPDTAARMARDGLKGTKPWEL
ncbi:MAG TPA: hypothetical protein VGH47_04545 [Xanthobacteraceae bacterium]|jgi:hypothetical protein